MMQKMIDTPGFNALVKGKYGYILFNKNDIYVGRAVEKYGEFSESEAELFRLACGPGDVVIEAGANIGTHTMALAAMVGAQGRIYAFEPQRIVFQTLCANMALNSIENVECYQMAVGRERGEVLLPDLRYDLEGNYGGVEIGQFSNGFKVPLVSLDDFLNIPRLRMLKIDVEGMEYEVISGARNLIARFKPMLYVENDRIPKSKALIELIRSLDYRMYWHLPPLFNPHNYAGDQENIYPGIVSVNMICFHRTTEARMEGFTEVTDSEFHPMAAAKRRV